MNGEQNARHMRDTWGVERPPGPRLGPSVRLRRGVAHAPHRSFTSGRHPPPDGKFIDKSFDGMLKDIEKAEGTAAMKNFIYEVSYHMHSAHAHATVDGLRQFETIGIQ